MGKFIIEGGKPLKGQIGVAGAKNAATPILAACLLTTEPCLIENLPLITDVFAMIEILKSMGVKVNWLGKRSLRIQAPKDLNLEKINQDSVCKMRSSILLLGALISRFKKFSLPQPGGCIIGARPIDSHLDALESLGVKILVKDRCYFVEKKELVGNEITMKEFSVTATENTILAAVLAEGRTIIKCAAAEPYVQDLCYFLRKMGAKISGIGTHTLIIEGVKKLKGAQHFLIYDPIEMITFLSLAGAVKARMTIKNVIPEFIQSELVKFEEVNLAFKIKNQKIFKKGWNYQVADVEVWPSGHLLAVKKVHNMPYPGFAADGLPPFAVLLTQAEGTSLVHDWMFEGRQKYIDELNKMGANAIICDPHRALITGPTPLYGTKITSFDLRAGATLIIAALVAKGQSEINNVQQVDRGYEMIEKRLKKIGASIRRIGD
jgi:UDP-N-acetylglucosamine 1-carboxyvinyltransferase